jgi:ferredoxin
MDFTGNPDPEEDWPETTVECQRASGPDAGLTLAFTPAEWALAQPELAGEFKAVGAGCPTENLTTIGGYLPLDPEEAMERLPYVWGADETGRLHRLVMTRRLALACRERLDFWHTLQELAGIRSEYVLEAVRRTRAELEAQADEERARLAEEHAEQLAQARRDAVGDAMRTLSNRLLDLDLTAPLAPAEGAPAEAPTAPMPAAPAPEPSSAEANGDQTAVSDEPWIDTPLCTSCNDCINVNSLLFTYDGNKQAVIGDPSAGTFAQLVQAAEKCPARCIHPGSPRNPDEPGLEDLVRRAKPFQ